MGTDKYAIGNTKILMMPQIKQVLDRCMEKASLMRNQQAKVLKQAFLVLNGALTFKSKVQTMKCIQSRWKLNYLKLQKKQADHFKEIFEKAIITYKADRR